MMEKAKSEDLCAERASILQERRESLELLKAGSDGKSLKKHVNPLAARCKRIEGGGKALAASLTLALQKTPAEREDSDREHIKAFEELMDQRVAALEKQLGESGLAADAARKEQERVLLNVRRDAEGGQKEKEKVKAKLIAERDGLVKARREKFEPLKAGDWEGKPPARTITAMAKFFKDLDEDSAAYTEPLIMALKLLPADRSEFHKKVISQFDGLLESRVKSAEEKIQAVEAAPVPEGHDIVEAFAALDALGEKCEEAAVTQRQLVQKAGGVEDRRQRTEAIMNNQRESVKETLDAWTQATNEVAEKQAASVRLQQAREGLGRLGGRQPRELEQVQVDSSAVKALAGA